MLKMHLLGGFIERNVITNYNRKDQKMRAYLITAYKLLHCVHVLQRFLKKPSLYLLFIENFLYFISWPKMKYVIFIEN